MKEKNKQWVIQYTNLWVVYRCLISFFFAKGPILPHCHFPIVHLLCCHHCVWCNSDRRCSIWCPHVPRSQRSTVVSHCKNTTKEAHFWKESLNLHPFSSSPPITKTLSRFLIFLTTPKHISLIKLSVMGRILKRVTMRRRGVSTNTNCNVGRWCSWQSEVSVMRRGGASLSSTPATLVDFTQALCNGG